MYLLKKWSSLEEFKLLLDIKKFVYLELLEKLLFFGTLELLFIGLNLLFSPLELLLKLLI